MTDEEHKNRICGICEKHARALAEAKEILTSLYRQAAAAMEDAKLDGLYAQYKHPFQGSDPFTSLEVELGRVIRLIP